MRALKWFLLWLCVLAVAGCVPTAVPASPTPAPTVTPTYTAAPLTATVPPTPTPAPSATPTATTLPTLTPVPLLDDVSFLARPEAASVRVMSYNVNWDSIFPALDPENHELRSASRVVAFRRLLAAVQPDVVCLQEINPERDPEQVSAVLETALAPAGGQDWTAAGRRDSMIAARFPVLSAGYELAAPVFPRELAQAAALVDLPDEVYGPRDLYLICAHFKAGGNFYDIVLRQRQADVIMHQLGEALSPGGNLDLPADTPLIVLGDFNIYDTDPAAHLQTLLTGDIDNEDQYGPDVAPDWDGTALADASPSHNAQGADFYTWRNDASPLNPGALDRIIYADSVLSVANAFVLNTEAWSDAALASAGLERDDVLLDPATGYYDHLPLVVDFEIKQP